MKFDQVLLGWCLSDTSLNQEKVLSTFMRFLMVIEMAMMMEMSKLTPVFTITIITIILSTMRMLMPRLTLVRPGGSTVGWPCSKGTTPGIMMVTVMITR